MIFGTRSFNLRLQNFYFKKHLNFMQDLSAMPYSCLLILILYVTMRFAIIFRYLNFNSQYDFIKNGNINHSFFINVIIFHAILVAKTRISTPLMMEKPVRSPMVPPIADSMSANFAVLSFSILSNVGVTN